MAKGYKGNPLQLAYNKWLHRYIIFVIIVTAVLIYAGSLVTTIGAGLAVPDWPLSFGSFNPSGWWKQPMVREEHGHRLIGATVGLMTIIMCGWLVIKGKLAWQQRLGILALIVVIIQGILGGLRVIDRNIYFAMAHACLAQGFFCILITLAWGTSWSWQQTGKNGRSTQFSDLTLATLLCASVFIQLIVGAVMRHSGAGMAIPTFPLVFEGIVPPVWDFKIGIHYMHRVWALVVLTLASCLCLKGFRDFDAWPRAMATLTLGFTLIQFILGGIIIWTGRAILPTTFHVLLGAFILASSLSCVLWLHHSPGNQLK